VHPIFRVPPPKLPHRSRVMRLYRGALKRFSERFPDVAMQQNSSWMVRNLFEKHRHERNAYRAEEILANGEERFRYFLQSFPDRYYLPKEKRGTSYQRNTPLPHYALDPIRYINLDRLDEELERFEDIMRQRRTAGLIHLTPEDTHAHH